MNVLRSFADAQKRETPVTINFHFNLAPSTFMGEDKLTGVQFRSPSGEMVEIQAQLAVTCVGYESLPCCSASPQNGIFANDHGKIGERLYVVGWAKRGPSGTIPTNRVEAQQLAQKMAQEICSNGRPGREALQRVLEERCVRWVNYAGWRNIDAAELSCADTSRCREKFCSTNEMLDTAHAGQFRPA